VPSQILAFGPGPPAGRVWKDNTIERNWADNVQDLDSVNHYLDGDLWLHEESQEKLADMVPVLGSWF
jgi:hypothetical protein